MDKNEEFIKHYVANEKVLSLSTSSASEKAAAWRRQALLLQQLARNSSHNTKHELLQQQYAKLKAGTHREEYLRERAQSVARLLNGFPKHGETATASAEEFPKLDEFLFEPPCRGTYESCQYDEITAEQLQFLQRKKGAVASSTSKPTTDHGNTCNKSPEQTRHTILNFLQPQRKQIRLSEDSNSNVEKGEISEKDEQASAATKAYNCFRTAREELTLQNLKKYGGPNASTSALATSAAASTSPKTNTPLFNYNNTKKFLGSRRTVRSNFVLPVANSAGMSPGADNVMSNSPSPSPPEEGAPMDERLINIDPKMVTLISNEIMHKYKPVAWSDIAGLEYVKSIIKEAVVYPLLRPDIFTGLRRPPRGILLFGPPGTGKTLIGKCIASQSKSTFFSISASSLTSKWVGDGEKMVRAMFAVAAVHQPSVVFIDEIDSLLSQRSETEHESSRRLKNEFLIQLDGAATSEDDRILIVGATNRPQELDEAARRRLVRRLYIPLPEQEARMQIMKNLLSTVHNSLTPSELQEIGRLTQGYSGADMDTLCREASMEPIRSIPAEEIPSFSVQSVRAVNMSDFSAALQNVRPSVSELELVQYTEWNKIYGASR